MKKQNVVRLYNFSDARLVSVIKEKISFMRRDQEVFTPFGITSALLTALETDADSFADSVSDIEAISDQTGVTAQKVDKADQLKMAIRAVMARETKCLQVSRLYAINWKL